MPKISGCGKTFKIKYKNNKLLSIRINGEKLSETYKATWNKTEDFKNIELNALPVYDDGYIKTKIRTYTDTFI